MPPDTPSRMRRWARLMVLAPDNRLARSLPESSGLLGDTCEWNRSYRNPSYRTPSPLGSTRGGAMDGAGSEERGRCRSHGDFLRSQRMRVRAKRMSERFASLVPSPQPLSHGEGGFWWPHLQTTTRVQATTRG